MPKVKPTRQEIHDLVRRTANEVIEEHPFIRLGPPPTRWGQLTDAERSALPQTERDELVREELADIHASLITIGSKLGADIGGTSRTARPTPRQG